MTRGRKPNPTTPPVAVELNQEALEEANQAATQVVLAGEYADEVLAAGMDIGRLEALDFVATVANSAILPIYENVKKSKAWRHLKNPQSSNGSNFLSLDEFCQVKLGKTYGRLQHLVANRNLIGQEAFEQAERLGLHQRDFNAIKTLPAPDQELVRRAIEEATSREEVVDLLQEMAARHATERAALAQKNEEAKADLEAKDKVIKTYSEEKDKLQEQLSRPFKPREDALAKSQEEQSLLDELQTASFGLSASIGRLMVVVDTAMKYPSDAMQTAGRQAVDLACQMLAQDAERFGIRVNLDELVRPEWLDMAALDELTRRNEAAAAKKAKG